MYTVEIILIVHVKFVLDHFFVILLIIFDCYSSVERERERCHTTGKIHLGHSDSNFLSKVVSLIKVLFQICHKLLL